MNLFSHPHGVGLQNVEAINAELVTHLSTCFITHDESLFLRDNLRMNEQAEIFFERLDQRRTELGLSDRALSLAAGASQDLIRTARNKNHIPNATNLANLARAMGVSVDWLLGGNSETTPIRSDVSLGEERLNYRANVAGNDLPVLGTGHCATISFGSNGDAVEIEQTQFEPATVIRYVTRPLALMGMKEAYAVYFQGESMLPRFKPGGLGIVNPARPPGIGDDVLVQMFNESGEIDTILVKTLRRSAPDFIELEQYNPPAIFRVPRDRVARIHRILDTADLWGG